jgi:uncharacterized FAD-dependent dehydrogenase
MGNRIVELRCATNTGYEEILSNALKKVSITQGKITILKKSLDARKKQDIHWQYRLLVSSEEIKNKEITPPDIEYYSALLKERRKNNPIDKSRKKVIVVGSGPAGIFPALALALRGYTVRLIEQGQPVEQRKISIIIFEQGGEFPQWGNYAYGEGGAGTFSDGKLTSRSKGISKERDFLTQQYIAAGAPEEIAYLAHPHLGSDNLFTITQKLRKGLINLGGEIDFLHRLEDLEISNHKIQEMQVNGKSIHGDYLIMAPGHSCYESYAMLIKRGIEFKTKIMALGFRGEHPQELINRAQWGNNKLKGVKAAEYRLTAGTKGSHRVYSFCMCPGGMVVPAAPRSDLNIVNGMSNYNRDGHWANAAILCSFNPKEYLGENITSLDLLTWLENLEGRFKDITGDYSAPSCTIEDFLKGTLKSDLPTSSYPFGLKATELWNELPSPIIEALKEGLQVFSRKLQGYDKGILLGLESKSSSPFQVIRNTKGHVENVENFYITGEGSGWSGGIVSSAADGLRSISALLQ